MLAIIWNGHLSWGFSSRCRQIWQRRRTGRDYW